MCESQDIQMIGEQLERVSSFGEIIMLCDDGSSCKEITIARNGLTIQQALQG